MGQKYWAGACAVVVAVGALAATPVVRGQHGGREQADPFADDGAAESDSMQGPANAARRIERILDQPLRSPLEYPETPLNTIAGILSQEYELPIVFDTAALDAIAASPEVQVSINIQNVSLRSALELMLAQLEDITYVIDQEVLLITTEDEAQTRLETRVYRVDDLLHSGASPASEIDEDRFETLLDIIVSTVECDSWQENGTGEGEIQSFQPGMFVVSQTQRVHEKVVDLLAEMRRVKSEIEAAGPAESTVQRPVTRAFRILGKDFTEAESSRASLRNAILRTVDWEKAGAELTDKDVFLEVFPNRVVVRHFPNVVRDVERALEKWDALSSAAPVGPGMGFSGGEERGAARGGGLGGASAAAQGRGGF